MDFDALKKTIQDVQKLGDLSFVVFNAARIRPSQPLEAEVGELEEDFRVCVLLSSAVSWLAGVLEPTNTWSDIDVSAVYCSTNHNPSVELQDSINETLSHCN